MKNAKLVTGILSIVFTVIVMFQSCAAGIYNTLSANGEVSGTAGMFVAALMLAGGIVEIATRNAMGRGGSIAVIVLFGLAALLGYGNAGEYTDLNIWATWCLAIVMLYIISILKNNRPQNFH